MKCKILLTVFLLISLSAIQAQIKKGSILLGGTLALETEKTNNPGESRQTTFFISPSIGKAIRDNLIAGVDLMFSTTENTGETNFNVNYKGYGAGFFLRKYAPLGKNFYLFGDARLGGSYNKNKSEQLGTGGSGSYSEGYNINLRVYPGISYSVSNKLQVELGLPSLINANYYRDLQGQKSTRNSFTLRSALGDAAALTVGIRVLLNKNPNFS